MNNSHITLLLFPSPTYFLSPLTPPPPPFSISLTISSSFFNSLALSLSNLLFANIFYVLFSHCFIFYSSFFFLNLYLVSYFFFLSCLT